ncbi:M12 family metallo-peptidase [Kaarinaea lacus]
MPLIMHRCKKIMMMSVMQLVFSSFVFAEEIYQVTILPSGDELNVSWRSFGDRWTASVVKDPYLGGDITLIKVNVTTGDEELITLLPNCYYRGVLTNVKGKTIDDTVVFLNVCDNALPFTGFVSRNTELYVIERDALSPTGITMRLESTTNGVNAQDDLNTDSNGWKDGGSGGTLTPLKLVPREMSSDKFPSMDIYVNPSYVSQVGEQFYISRIIETLAGANIIYAQSGLKQIHLAAILLLDQDISEAENAGNVLHGVEKIRKYTVLPDGADISMVYSGGEFSMPYLWGWAEGGYACDLQQAVAEGGKINTQNVAKSAFAVIDLPTVIQRAWIVAHEAGHTLGMPHVYNDPLAYGTFQQRLALKDYVAGCAAKTRMYQTCKYDPQTNKFQDLYSCE